jgi:hypothetical protein
MTLNRFAIYAPYKRKNEYVIVEEHPIWGAFLFGKMRGSLLKIGQGVEFK